MPYLDTSGGHLALLYAYHWDSARKDVAVVMDLLGPTDFTEIVYAGNPLYIGVVTALTGPVPGWAELRRVSPVTWVNPSSAKTLGFYAEGDLIVPVSQGRRLKARLDHMGVENDFTFFPGSHYPLWRHVRREIVIKIGNFLRKHWI